MALAKGAPLGRVAGAAHFEKALERPGELVEKLGIVLDDDDRAGGRCSPAHVPDGSAGLTGSGSGGDSGSGTTPGKIRRMIVPPGLAAMEWTLIEPSWKRMISAAVERPRPTPSGLVVWKGRKSLSRRNSCVIPVPLSMMSTTARGGLWVLSVKVRMTTFPPVGVAS